MTLREFVLMCRGHRTAESRKWERSRLISYTIAASNRDPAKAFPSIEKYLPLPTDDSQVRDQAEDLNETRRRLVEYYNTTYGKNLA